MTSYTKTKTTKALATESKVPFKTLIDKYQTITKLTIKKGTNKVADKKGNTQKYQQKYIPKNNKVQTKPNKRGDTKTETTKDRDYLIKITTTRKSAGGFKLEDKPRGGSMPRGGERPREFREEPKGSERPRSI